MKRNKSFLQEKNKDILLYTIFFVIMLILNRSSVIGIKIPFGSSFLFSLLLLGKNALILAPSYFVSYIIYNISFEGFIIGLSVVSVLLLLYLISKLLNKKINFTWTMIFCLLSQVGYIYFHISTPAEMVVSLVIIAVCLMFVYVCMQATGALLNRGLQSRFTLDENICFSLFLIIIFSGISNLYIFNINLSNLIVFFVLMITNRTLSRISVVYMSALAGFGAGFASGGVTYIAIYVSWAIVCVVFKEKPKICSLLSVILVDCVFGYFLNSYAYYSYLNILTLIFGGVIYLCLPEKLFNYIRGFSYSYDGNLANEFIVYGQKQVLKNKLKELSELFRQIQVSYRNLSVGEIDRTNVSGVLTEELFSKHCSGCVNCNYCIEKDVIMKMIVHFIYNFYFIIKYFLLNKK